MRNLWPWVLVTKSLLSAGCLSLLSRYNRLFIAFSGGLDSTVLLYTLAAQPALVSKLIAVHINHGLSPNAQIWQEHCQQFCNDLKLPLVIKQVNFKRHANIEEAARKARYSAFEQLIEQDDCLVLAHHLNDQAETLLLQLFRGAGIDGLASMPSVREFAKGRLLRPLLPYTRQTLENYAEFHQLKWIDDETNQNLGFSRNYLRHQIMPLLRSRWPGIVNSLGRTAEHCQQAQENLDDLAKIDCPALTVLTNQLPIAELTILSKARLSNVLRVWFKMNKVRLPSTATFNRLIGEVIQAGLDANPYIAWDDSCVRRYQQTLYLLKSQSNHLPALLSWSSFPKPLDLGEERGSLSAIPVDKGLVIPAQSRLEIRFRQGGESFNWHGQTKQLKKLFQEWHVPPWLRDRIPLLYVNEQLACVVGYGVSDAFYQLAPGKAWQLQLN